MVMDQTLAVKVGVGLAAAVGITAYCVYFDRRRRSHPDFRSQLIQRRQAARIRIQQAVEEEEELENKLDGEEKDEKLEKESTREQFFKQLIMVNAMVEEGEWEEAVEQLVVLAAIYFESVPVFEILEEVLLPEMFGAFLMKLPDTGEIMKKMIEQAAAENEEDGKGKVDDENDLDEEMLAVLMSDPKFMKSVIDSMNETNENEKKGAIVTESIQDDNKQKEEEQDTGPEEKFVPDHQKLAESSENVVCSSTEGEKVDDQIKIEESSENANHQIQNEESTENDDHQIKIEESTENDDHQIKIMESTEIDYHQSKENADHQQEPNDDHQQLNDDEREQLSAVPTAVGETGKIVEIITETSQQQQPSVSDDTSSPIAFSAEQAHVGVGFDVRISLKNLEI